MGIKKAIGKKGEKYGLWTLLEDQSTPKVRVVCDCGTEKLIEFRSMTRGLSTSCGCVKTAKVKAGSYRHASIDMIGKTFGHLTVTGVLPDRRVSAVCKCGAVGSYIDYKLRSGHTRS